MTSPSAVPLDDERSSASLRPLRILFSALTGVIVTAFPAVILVASLPEIAADLGSSETTISWVITAPILVSSVMLPMFGRLGDTHGHRRLFLWGLGIAGVCSALCAVAWNVTSLIVLRSVGQAAGMATHPAAIALLMASYRGQARNKSLGYWAFVAASSPSLGLAFGGPLVGATGWRAIFVVQAVAALAGVVFARFGLRETTKRLAQSLDLAGGLVLMLAIGALLLVLDRGRHWGWDSPAILVCAAVSVIAAGLFVVVERRSHDPMLPISSIRDKGFTMPMLAEFLAQSSNMGVFFIIPFILHGQFGQGAAGTALLMLPLPLGMAAFSPVGGRLSWTLGSRATSLIGNSALCVSIIGIGVAVSQHLLLLLLVAMAVQGASNGLLRPANTTALSQVLDDGSMGVGMATMRMSAQVGTALGVTIAVATSNADGTGNALVAAFVIAAVALVVSTQLIGRRGRGDLDLQIATTAASIEP